MTIFILHRQYFSFSISLSSQFQTHELHCSKEIWDGKLRGSSCESVSWLWTRLRLLPRNFINLNYCRQPHYRVKSEIPWIQSYHLSKLFKYAWSQNGHQKMTKPHARCVICRLLVHWGGGRSVEFFRNFRHIYFRGFQRHNSDQVIKNHLRDRLAPLF